MSDGAGTETRSRALSPSPQRRKGGGLPAPRAGALETIGGGKTVLVANADEVRAVYLQAARHQRAQDALLELLTQKDLKERRLSWEMLSRLAIDARREGSGGGAPTQILIQNHLPVPPRPPTEVAVTR